MRYVQLRCSACGATTSLSTGEPVPSSCNACGAARGAGYAARPATPAASAEPRRDPSTPQRRDAAGPRPMRQAPKVAVAQSETATGVRGFLDRLLSGR